MGHCIADVGSKMGLGWMLFCLDTKEAHTTPLVGKLPARLRFRRVDVRVLCGAVVGLRARRLTSAAEALLPQPLARASASAPDAAPDVRLL